MKIALYGASGMIGQRILKEAQDRHHEVAAVSRNDQNGDILNPKSVAATAEGQDVVISAFGPGGGDTNLVAQAADSLLAGLAGKKTRLVVVGGAGGLEVAPGVRLVDSPDFPPGLKQLALSHLEAYNRYRANTSVFWSYAAPAAIIEPGQRTSKFRPGGDQLIVDSQGQSRISAEDFAVAVLDEVESPKALHKRFTVGY
jgi:putative NADH-flavin reductase